MITYGLEVKEGSGDSTENIAGLEFPEREMLGCKWLNLDIESGRRKIWLGC